MLSDSKKQFWGITLSLSFFVTLEIIIRFTNIYYLEQPEIFFVNSKRKFVESGKGNADILILGDSRSMALAGYLPNTKKEYSVYNHSLPAMGPKYYRFFLEKYLEKGNQKPKMLLFAASPKLYSVGYGPPLYDPNGDSVSENESLVEYLKRRWKEGWSQNLFRSSQKKNTIIQYSGKQEDRDQILWEFFGHRYLHQFSFLELAHQYEGAEEWYILSKSAPLLYHSYRFRGAIRNAMSLENWKVKPNYKERSVFCDSCENIQRGLCLPPSSQLEDNLIIEDQIQRHLGKYNISNRLKPEQIFFARQLMEKELSILTQAPVDPNLPDPDFQVLEDLIAYCKSQGIEFGFLYLPWVKEREERQEQQIIYQQLKQFFRNHSEVGYFEFPDVKYPQELFVDNIHYDCRGEARVNQEFQDLLRKKIFVFLKSKEKSY